MLHCYSMHLCKQKHDLNLFINHNAFDTSQDVLFVSKISLFVESSQQHFLPPTGALYGTMRHYPLPITVRIHIPSPRCSSERSDSKASKVYICRNWTTWGFPLTMRRKLSSQSSWTQCHTSGREPLSTTPPRSTTAVRSSLQTCRS